ncbi:MAG: hypothetical protein JNM99_11010 [Verrucomicrobiaceae bacterium]|nr:hypothetical protein [Verrucomicrobiaceae bacterium]
MRLLVAFLLATQLSQASTQVTMARVPEHGVQPQIARGSDGTLHLVYLVGDAVACDLRYSTKPAGATSWTAPITVNSDPHSAIAMGTIRGAQLAIGRDGTVHVVWNGSNKSVPPRSPAPLHYAQRSRDGSFTTQRNVRGDTQALDGGASIAASAKGEVFIVWHGAPAEAEPGEEHRVVFVLKSADNGHTFGPVTIANLNDQGVCACCSLKTMVTPDGDLITLYRAARTKTQRDITVLSSRDGGTTFTQRIVGPWAINACPMSSASLVPVGGRTRAAWEAEGKIYSALLDANSPALLISEDPGRHPALAINDLGETLVVWSIGTGWQRGGSLAWRILDASGQPTDTQGRTQGVPVWGFTAAYAQGKDFVILY